MLTNLQLVKTISQLAIMYFFTL